MTNSKEKYHSWVGYFSKLTQTEHLSFLPEYSRIEGGTSYVNP